MAEFIPFTCNLESFEGELKKLLEQNTKAVEQLLAQENKTYQNFVRPLMELDYRLELFFSPLAHLNSVANSKETQEVYTKALPLITEYSTNMSQNLKIYEAYKEISKQEALSSEQKRVLTLAIQSFELSGAHLDEKTKKRLAEINLEKSELTNNFSQNLLDATNAYEKIIENEKDVEGLPKSDLLLAKFEQDGKTKYRFTLQLPSYIAYMTYGKNEQIREELYKAYTTRAPKNAKIIDRLLVLRDESAKLLGFENYAAYSLATKMANSPGEVLDFLEELLEKSTAQAKKEYQELEAFAGKKLNAWDSAYYSEALRKKFYDIDEEKYREYFEQNGVLEGLFAFLENLFGIGFVKQNEPLWDPKATSYNLVQNEKVFARLYLDLEARESKRGGAWMDNFQTHHYDEKNKEHLASAFVVCNFPPSDENTPSLLRHDDVVTLFHEMGHALHHLLSKVSELDVSGVHGVEWDAVEFPSQFLENFAYEKEVLQTFAKHYKTKEVLNDEMIEKLQKAKNFQSAMGMLRQLEFGLFDMKLHTGLYQAQEVQKLLDTIREKTALIKPPAYNRFQNGFGHIFAGGYAAGYYSYKWAEVLSADGFLAVVQNKKINTAMAKRYKESILFKGGSASMKELYKEFADTEPKTDALLKLSGIL